MTISAVHTAALGLIIADDFTQGAVNDSAGATSSNGMDWLAISPACLTAGNSTNNSTSVANTASTYSNIPACNITTGSGITTADTVGSGALRLTAAAGNQAGAIISRGTFPSNQGIQVTFTAYTYGGSGADGIGFFLQDASVPTSLSYVGDNVTTGNYNIGESGGSLGYTCSNNKSQNYNGLTGGYIGLGMDVYGNFTNPGDNTASGPGQLTNTISLRGAGSVSWYWLSSRYPSLYPTTTGSSSQKTIVENTCRTGFLQDGGNGNLTYSTSALSWSNNVLTVTVGSTVGFVVGDTINIATSSNNNPPRVNGTSIVGSYVVTAVSGSTFSFAYPGGSTSYSHVTNGRVTVKVMDYPYIIHQTLPSTTPIWSQVSTRAAATPMTYKLSISPTGLLNFQYSYNGGTYQSVLANTPITTSNGPLPANFRFGFLGSTGGATNIHEITCFAAQPTSSSSSAGANTVQSGQVRTGTQVYLASYNPNNWNGTLVSDAIVNTNGVLSVSTTSQWDGNCVLTGGACASTGTTVALETPSNRNILTWNGSSGVPFTWTNLTLAQKAVLDSTDSAGSDRLDWLRGTRTLEQVNGGSFRNRAGVLGDIIDSSPTWVGSPSKNYPSSFVDALTGSVGPEASYATFKSNLATRQHVVYAGSNDGILHGFRTGSNNSSGTYNATTNDGYEVLGFVPSTVLSNSKVVGLTSQNYSHSFFVDAAPGFGDVYYNGAWHTWLVGGMGTGGAEIFALDVTDPTGVHTASISFSEAHAASIVLGDWTTASLTAATCVHAASNCGDNLGNTFGTPLIRRLHNGQWAIIFGNGLGSTNGHAGVYVGLISPTNGSVSFYWLDTGSGGTGSSANGIANVSSADMDGDFVIDYLYAGDLQGNVWRFDLTSSTPTDWAVSNFGQPSAAPLYVAQDSSGNRQPITTSIAVTGVLTGGAQRVILGFGTGRATLFTSSSATTYQSGTQTVYGIWDWDMSAWNTASSTPYASLAQVAATPYRTFTRSDLFTDTVASQTSTTRRATVAVVCWFGSSACTQPANTAAVNTKYGWKFDLPDTGEQVIYNPVFSGGELLLNTTIPPSTSASQCSTNLPTGWTMAFDIASGGGKLQNVFPDSTGSLLFTSGSSGIVGLKQGAVGTPYVVSIGSKQYAISSSVGGGSPPINELNTQGGVKVKRISWEQLR